ncbi:ATP-binding cassette domain-containing protein [SAR202 cluster bacterium AC-647-N09_OGT_505m]|nr:ATP-binding cassette domain-containing protein [SAR202 cluster bacterium AC-647-N09_OGT_505m]
MEVTQSEILRAEDLYHVYQTEAVDGNVVGLRGIYITVNQKEVVSVVGPSGSGKSTLMKCLGGLMKPSAGDIFFEGKSISRLNPTELLNLRQRTVSFIFQDSNLLPYMDIVNNVALPLKYLKVSPRRARREAMILLERLGIAPQSKMLPSQVSGGEKQRAAIARSLITKPKIIIADEPTGSVDLVTSRDILRLFREMVDEVNVSFLIVTHSSEVAAFADRSLELIDGRFVAEHGANIDVSNLSGTRRIILDRTGNMTLPTEIMAKIGGLGIFDVTNVDKDELSMMRVVEEGNEPESRLITAAVICPVCGYEYESAETDTCARCGALRTHRT